MISPQVQAGEHTFDVQVADREDGNVTVKLKNAALRGTTFKQPPFAEANFHPDEETVIEAWIAAMATIEVKRLDGMRRI